MAGDIGSGLHLYTSIINKHIGNKHIPLGAPLILVKKLDRGPGATLTSQLPAETGPGSMPPTGIEVNTSESCSALLTFRSPRVHTRTMDEETTEQYESIHIETVATSADIIGTEYEAICAVPE